MSENREEILANFQECTGIENIEEAIMWLESAQWDLLTAINNAVPQEDQMRIYGNAENRNQNVGPNVTLSSDFMKLPSDSKDDRILEIELHDPSGEVHKLQVPESMTVGCVKTLIYSKTGIAPCKQNLSGWPKPDPNGHLPDDTSLKTLNAPSTIHLFINLGNSSNDFVTEMDVTSAMEANIREHMGLTESGDQSSSRPSGSRVRNKRKARKEGDIKENTVHLKILDGNRNKEHDIKVSATKRVSDVKKDIANITGISLSKQTWLGWPDNTMDSMELSGLGLEKPVHHLTVVKLEGSPESRRKTRSQNAQRFPSSPGHSDSGADSDSLEEVSESFSAEDEMFTEDTAPRNRIAPLMPDNVEDETVGSVTFIDGYTQRYGQTSPNFFSGALENAINEAFAKTGRDKRMLAIYVHHDGSILTNVFCSELLGSESILQIFATYFVLWGWDVTNRRNRDMLLESVQRQLGQNVAHAISSIKPDDFPALLIVSRLRSNVELLNVIQGNIGANELLNVLVSTIDIFTEKLELEIQNEEERAARDRIKFEQDMAYQESLILDKAKEESRRQQLLLQSQEEERLKQEEERRAAEKLSVESRLPEEPPEDTSSKEVMTFRFRTPTGDFFIRRFRVSDNLQTVFDYLLVKGFRVNEFKVISPWPRKDLSSLEGTLLLKDVGLCPQETLTLEER